MPQTISASTRARLVALFALVILLYGAGLTRMGFEGTDERRYALVSKEIWMGEGAFVMHFMRDLYPDKPPLFFWAQAACYSLAGGVGPGAARAPLFVASVLCVAFAFLTMRQLGGDRTALLGAALLALSFRFLWSGRIARLDTPMCAFVYASFWASARLLFPRADQNDSPAAHWRWAMFAWVSIALSVLTKGPGVIPWLGSLLVYAAVRRDASVLRRHHMLAGGAVMLAIVMAWFIPAALMGGRDYIGPMIGTHVVKRAFDVVRHNQPFWYFFGKIMLDGFPVSIFLPAGLWWALRRPKRAGSAPARLEGPVLFAVVWFLFTLVFFSLPAGKRGQYILPLYPAMAFLIARFMDAALFGDKGALKVLRRHLWPVVVGLALAPVLIAGATFAGRSLGVNSGWMDPIRKAMDDFQAPVDARIAGAALGIALVCGAAGVVQLARGRAGGALAASGAGFYLIYLFLFAYFMPLNRSDSLSREVADIIIRHGFTLDQLGDFRNDCRFALYGPGVSRDISSPRDQAKFFARREPLLVIGDAARISLAGNKPQAKRWTRVAAWEDAGRDPERAPERRMLLYANPAAAPAFAEPRVPASEGAPPPR